MLGEAVGDMNCRVQNSGVIDERGWGAPEVGQWIPPIANCVLQPPDAGLSPWFAVAATTSSMSWSTSESWG